MAPQGRMRGGFAAIARKRVATARPSLISQRSGPLTASPEGEATQPINNKAGQPPLRSLPGFCYAFLASPSGKMILFTKKKITIEMPPFRTVVPML